MKNEKLEMKCEVWNYLRQYRLAPYIKKYHELLNIEKMENITAYHK
jgi:hypothetical protein